MSKLAKWLVGVLIAITAVSVIAVAFMAASKHGDTDDDDEQEAVQVPSHVSTQNGRTVVTLDQATQAREGIQVESLKQTSMHTELHGTAVLLAVNDLATLRNNYLAAQTKIERDQVNVNVSRTQYERVKTLYSENQNMSLQAMQDAEATYRNHQAQERADQQDAGLQLDTIRQRWGPVVARWISAGNPAVEAILEQRDFLAQVVFPSGEVAQPPATLALMAPGEKRVRAQLISPLPQVNAQIQGISFLYLVPGRSGMAVGMNLAVLVPTGRAVNGAVVPQSAVVWWQAQAWAYQALTPTTFARVPVPITSPVAGGYFVPASSLPANVRIVTAGAQALLSEEFRNQIQQED